MKNLLSFFKITAMGGLLVLLPILLFILLLMEIVDLVVGLATPIAGLFPAGTFDDPKHPVVLAVFLLVAASLLIGILMKSKAAIRLGDWLQAKTIGRLPLYRFVKSLGNGEVIVLCPHAPTGFAGPVKIVPQTAVELLDASLGDVSLVLNHMGLGADRLLTASKNNTAAKPSK